MTSITIGVLFTALTVAYLLGRAAGHARGWRNGYAEGWRRRERYGAGGWLYQRPRRRRHG